MQKAGADAAKADDVAGPSFGGRLERVVATGHVELDKPGMHATGERLVYTASDRMVLLTGDAHNPPKAVGSQGTTTGAALRFNSCDGSVEAEGAPGQRVLTDAQVSGEGKKEKGKQ
jgi:lipopolysaccharide export system protein LptA